MSILKNKKKTMLYLCGAIVAILFGQLIVAYADDYPLSWQYINLQCSPGNYAHTEYTRSVATWAEIKYLGVTPSYADDFTKSSHWCPATEPGEPGYPDGGNVWFDVQNDESFPITVHWKFRWWVPQG